MPEDADVYVGLLVGLHAGANPVLAPGAANHVAAARRAVPHCPAKHAGPAGESGQKRHVSQRPGLPDLHRRPQDLQLPVELVKTCASIFLKCPSVVLTEAFFLF